MNETGRQQQLYESKENKVHKEEEKIRLKTHTQKYVDDNSARVPF